jgi:hypothetical protein
MVMLRYAVGSIPILFSAPPGKLSNTMVRYPDTLSLLKARALFFRDAKLGPDGGYSDRWVRVETIPIPFYFPNWPSRVAAARLHDLHHIATDYETDWPGEAEIAAWEIASGCARYHAAWILNFFYKNGFLYTGAIDIALILPFFAALYYAAFVFGLGWIHPFFATACLLVAWLACAFGVPKYRRRHLRLSSEQLDLIRRRRRDFVEERFREIVTEWRHRG